MKLYGVTRYDDLIDLPVEDGCVYLTREAAQRRADRMTYEDDGVKHWATVHSLDPCWDVLVCGPFDEDKSDWVRFIDYAGKIKQKRDGARTENAKLRQLIRDIWTSCPVNDEDCAICKHKGGKTVDGCALYDRMRELGIVVW